MDLSTAADMAIDVGIYAVMVLSIFILVEMATSTAVDIYINLQDRTIYTAIEMSIQAIV